MGAITAEVVDTGEKRDTRGRRVTPAERRLQMVAAYRASGATMAAFARRERINYATFAGWVAKATQQSGAKSPIRFAQVSLPLASSAAAVDPLEVRLADGTVLRGSRVGDLVALVRALRD
jgi:transposase-like protein